MYAKRLSKVKNILFSKNLDCLLLTDASNIFYISGFKGYEGIFLLIPKDKEPTLFVPKLEYDRANEESRIHVEHYENYKKALIESIERIACRKIGICYKRVPHHIVVLVKNKISNVNVVDISEDIANIRMIKDDEEIERIKRAVEIAEKGLEEARNIIGEGVSELEVAAKVEYTMRIMGSEKTPFATIVASGSHAALPHAVTSDKVIRSGEVVVVDLGATFKGYVSDLTRTISVGRVREEIKDMFQAVLEAQKAAIKAIKPGVKAAAVDNEARNVLKEYGYEKYFIHGTGHGIGIDVHEPPALRKESNIELKKGMVVTVEPGVYVKNLAGIRIEDDVVVTDTSYFVLSKFERNLVE